MGLNPSNRIPTKRRRAIPSDHSDMAVPFVGGITDGGTFWAVMPCGGIFLAVGGFRFLALTTSAEAVTPKYGGNFSAVGGFSVFGGNDFGGGGKTKIWR